MNRPGLLSLIEDIENGEVSSVTVRNISQLSRSLHDTFALLSLFKKYGVDLCITEPNANTASESAGQATA